MIILGKRGLHEIWTCFLCPLPKLFLMGLMKLAMEPLYTVWAVLWCASKSLHAPTLQAGLDGHSCGLPCSLAAGWLWSVQSLARTLERRTNRARGAVLWLPPSLPGPLGLAVSLN